jgi:Zn-dependent alcohol dehydrogenase
VMVNGTYSFPTVPGHEFAGIVDKVGAKVTHVAPGRPRRNCAAGALFRLPRM